MELYGMISEEDQSDGFILVLDDNYFVLLLHRGKMKRSFDPRDYTPAELRQEVDSEIVSLRSAGRAEVALAHP